MTREEQLMQEYEDLTFKILMDRVAQAEGTRLLEENERLLADPEAAVPEPVQRRTEKIIRDAFDERKKEFVHRSLRKALKVAIIAAILLALTATVAFAVSPTIRANIINTFRNVYDTHTDFFVVTESDIQTDHPSELDIQVSWIPEDFHLEEDGSISICTWKIYNREGYGQILVKKSLPTTISVDTENAEISTIDMNGNTATLISKPNDIGIFWTDIEKNVLYYISAQGLPQDSVIKFAENIS